MEPTSRPRRVFAISTALAAALWLPSARGSAQEASAAPELPAASRTWTGADYTLVATLVAEGKVPLPRLADPGGAPLVLRLISLENLELCRLRNVSLEARVASWVGMIQGTSQLLTAYGEAFRKPPPAPREESARFMGFMLHLAALGADLADQLEAALPEDDTRPARLEGLKKMRAGMAMTFVGAEVTLGEVSFTSREVTFLVADMAATLPRLRVLFEPDLVREMRGKLLADRRRLGPAHEAGFDAMLRALEDPLAPAPGGGATPRGPAGPSSSADRPTAG